MKIGDRVRFKVAYYNADLQMVKDTDEIAEGIIVNMSEMALVVKVDDKEPMPFFVRYDRVLEE